MGKTILKIFYINLCLRKPLIAIHTFCLTLFIHSFLRHHKWSTSILSHQTKQQPTTNDYKREISFDADLVSYASIDMDEIQSSLLKTQGSIRVLPPNGVCYVKMGIFFSLKDNWFCNNIIHYYIILLYERLHCSPGIQGEIFLYCVCSSIISKSGLFFFQQWHCFKCWTWYCVTVQLMVIHCYLWGKGCEYFDVDQQQQKNYHQLATHTAEGVSLLRSWCREPATDICLVEFMFMEFLFCTDNPISRNKNMTIPDKFNYKRGFSSALPDLDI